MRLVVVGCYRKLRYWSHKRLVNCGGFLVSCGLVYWYQSHNAVVKLNRATVPAIANAFWRLTICDDWSPCHRGG